MICTVCGLTLTKKDFSLSQLKKKKEHRKCIGCSEINVDTNEKYNVLLSWLKQNGSYFPNLEIKHYSNTFRGIVSNKNISKDKCIMRIPNKCIITTLIAKKSSICIELEKNLKPSDTFSTHTWIALYLINEKNNPNSYWKPYLDILPSHFMSFPHFYDKETLCKLDNTIVSDMIMSRNLSLEEEYNKIYNYLPSFSNILSLDVFKWARIMVITRVFHIYLGTDSSTQGLVPMADMLNHTMTPTTQWRFQPDEDCFVINSTSFQSKGVEVYDTYGPKCNSRYFVNYGFTQENNDYNQSTLFIHPNDIIDTYKCTHGEQKTKLLKGNHTNIDDSYTNYSYLVQNKLEKKVSDDHNFRFQFIRMIFPKKVSINDEKYTSLHSTHCLFGFLRFLLCTEKEFAYIVETINKSKQQNLLKILLCITPLSFETEYKVLHVLSDYCKKYLEKFPTTLEQDKEVHKTYPLYSKEWNISNVVQGEKEVLLFYIDLFSSIENLEYTDISKISKVLRKHPVYKIYYSLFLQGIYN